jgi:hypothetical protein
MGRKVSNPICTIWRHTKKAVRAGHPADRLFTVAWVDEDGECLAWKCEQRPNGMIKHPGYKEELSPEDERLFLMKAPNGAEPTAWFHQDSFYEMVRKGGA